MADEIQLGHKMAEEETDSAGWCSKELNLQLMMGSVLMAFNALTGIPAILNYCVTILKDVGFAESCGGGGCFHSTRDARPTVTAICAFLDRRLLCLRWIGPTLSEVLCSCRQGSRGGVSRVLPRRAPLVLCP